MSVARSFIRNCSVNIFQNFDKSYQSQGILITLVGDVIDQLEEVGYKTGANVRVIPLGKDVTAVIHVVSVALRAALIFGNVKPGDAATLMDYTMKCVPAFVNAFAPLNDVTCFQRSRIPFGDVFLADQALRYSCNIFLVCDNRESKSDIACTTSYDHII